MDTVFLNIIFLASCVLIISFGDVTFICFFLTVQWKLISQILFLLNRWLPHILTIIIIAKNKSVGSRPYKQRTCITRWAYYVSDVIGIIQARQLCNAITSSNSLAFRGSSPLVPPSLPPFPVSGWCSQMSSKIIRWVSPLLQLIRTR